MALCCAALAGRSNFASCDLSEYTEAADYSRRLMDALPENALLLVSDDNTIYSAWLEQVVEGRRPDVDVYGLNFIFQGWYRRYFEGRENISVFSVDLPPSYEAHWVVAVGGGVIIPNIENRPVLAALSGQWERSALLPNWRGEFLVDLVDPKVPAPPLFYAPPAPDIYRLSDNPEYNAYQRKQFADLYGTKPANEEIEQ